MFPCRLTQAILADDDINLIVSCNTKKEAQILCEALHNAGRTWVNGRSYIANISNLPNMATGYLINRGQYIDMVVAMTIPHKYKIILFSQAVFKQFISLKSLERKYYNESFN